MFKGDIDLSRRAPGTYTLVVGTYARSAKNVR